jgi:hypothetical protein
VKCIDLFGYLRVHSYQISQTMRPLWSNNVGICYHKSGINKEYFCRRSLTLAAPTYVQGQGAMIGQEASKGTFLTRIFYRLDISPDNELFVLGNAKQDVIQRGFPT